MHNPIKSAQTDSNPIVLTDFGISELSNEKYYKLSGTFVYANPEMSMALLAGYTFASLDCKATDVWV
jgi:serine/threonine protein kinase